MTNIKNRWQNTHLDTLQDAIDYSNVLSSEFKNKISTFISWIGSNGVTYQKDVIEKVNELIIDMHRVKIFSDEFISFVVQSLLNGLDVEVSKINKNYPISINGKLITNMEILSNSENEVKGFVLSNETVKHHLQGLDIVKVIVFMGKLVNIVTKIK